MVQSQGVQRTASRTVQGAPPHTKMSINVSHYYYHYKKKEKLNFLYNAISQKVLKNILSEASNKFLFLMALTVMF